MALKYQEKHVPNVVTLCFLIDRKNDKVLLGKKQYGHGEGKYNGFGGKLEWNDDSISDGMRREVKEEAGVEIDEQKLSALILFYPSEEYERITVGYIYTAETWQGTPENSEEMHVSWHDLSRLPFSEMWEDDVVWVPHVLAGGTYVIHNYTDKVRDERVRIEEVGELREGMHEEHM